jgi:aryl-alcohol dehydrogenase-like predicted oxidoreductase/enamine deaminase RidA (YjgF/YER057c/UK114 family)
MNAAVSRPPRIKLAPGLEVPRLLTGLWQVADMERGGKALNTAKAARSLAEYVDAGFDAFDMADHYGSAELIVGRLLKDLGPGRARAFTKWCPPPGPMTAQVVRAGVQARLDRLGVPAIDLLQFHWWQYRHPAYLDAMTELGALRGQGLIRHIGVTNFDTDHLRLLVQHGIPVATNQVSFSLLDRRAAGRMSEFCRAAGVKLLAYGTLGGGFLSERWLGKPEPRRIPDWSKSKYRRFIHAIGGWQALQGILAAASAVAKKHGVSIANVATRWVLEHEAVGAVIVGVRPGESEHRADNLKVFSFAFDSEDRTRLQAALARTKDIAGDCGDEYRKPPFLTASGDLSHHLDSMPKLWRPVDAGRGRQRVDSGSKWEAFAGYSRAVRAGSRIAVSGTTATHGAGTIVCRGDPEGQAVYVLDKIAAGIEALGGRLEDVVRTRVFMRDISRWEPVARVHGRYFGDIRPANSLLGTSGLVGDYEIEIEAEAEVAPARKVRPKPSRISARARRRS